MPYILDIAGIVLIFLGAAILIVHGIAGSENLLITGSMVDRLKRRDVAIAGLVVLAIGFILLLVKGVLY